MLRRDWQTDDGQCKEQGKDQVHDGKFKSRENDPDDIHDEGKRTARRFGLAYFATEWRDNTARQPETHESERYADDGETQQDATEDITEKDYESTENKEHKVPD